MSNRFGIEFKKLRTFFIDDQFLINAPQLFKLRLKILFIFTLNLNFKITNLVIQKELSQFFLFS